MKNGHLATVSSDKTTLALYSPASGSPLALGIMSQAFANSKSLFFGKTAMLHLTIDEDAATRALGCATPKKGLMLLHLNDGPSSLTLG
jgi:hypothetical protein